MPKPRLTPPTAWAFSSGSGVMLSMGGSSTYAIMPAAAAHELAGALRASARWLKSGGPANAVTEEDSGERLSTWTSRDGLFADIRHFPKGAMLRFYVSLRPHAVSWEHLFCRADDLLKLADELERAAGFHEAQPPAQAAA